MSPLLGTPRHSTSLKTQLRLAAHAVASLSLRCHLRWPARAIASKSKARPCTECAPAHSTRPSSQVCPSVLSFSFAPQHHLGSLKRATTALPCTLASSYLDLAAVRSFPLSTAGRVSVQSYLHHAPRLRHLKHLAGSPGTGYHPGPHSPSPVRGQCHLRVHVARGLHPRFPCHVSRLPLDHSFHAATAARFQATEPEARLTQDKGGSRFGTVSTQTYQQAVPRLSWLSYSRSRFGVLTAPSHAIPGCCLHPVLPVARQELPTLAHVERTCGPFTRLGLREALVRTPWGDLGPRDPSPTSSTSARTPQPVDYGSVPVARLHAQRQLHERMGSNVGIGPDLGMYRSCACASFRSARLTEQQPRYHIRGLLQQASLALGERLSTYPALRTQHTAVGRPPP